MKRLTDFQLRLIEIMQMPDINEWQPTKDEQAFIDKYFGPPLTASQIYNMRLRHHFHLTEDEKGEGLKKIRKEKKPKSPLPNSLMPLLEPIVNDKADLKRKWSLFSKALWWSTYVKHIEVDERIWDIGERLLALYPNGRRSALIDLKESILHRTVIER